MRTLLVIVCLMLAGWLLGLWLPFWSLTLAAVLVGWAWPLAKGRSFLAGFIAGALLWGGLAGWADAANGHLLASRVGPLFGTGAWGMVGLTALLGGVLAGLGCLLGAMIRPPAH
jgi:hypothetical protein